MNRGLNGQLADICMRFLWSATTRACWSRNSDARAFQAFNIVLARDRYHLLGDPGPSLDSNAPLTAARKR